MFKRLLTCSVRVLLDIGHRIMSRLRADPRLAVPASILGTALSELEASDSAVESAKALVRDTGADRDEAGRKFEGLLREFGMLVLSSSGNHHDVQPYVVYFPQGYGDVRTQTPQELIQFAGQITTMLEKETDLKLAAYRSLIANACAEFVAVQDTYEAANRTRTDAVAFRKASRRLFVRALVQARSTATAAVADEPRYIKSIFAPAAVPRYVSAAAPDAEPATAVAETPAAMGVASSAPVGGAA